MQKITPHLWFDKEANDAAEFYVSFFPESRIKNTTTLHNTPSGSVQMVTLELSGQEFMFLSAGPFFTFNPSVSFMIACETKEEVTQFWEKLSKDGTVLMELGEYPFSQWYGWVQDRFGVSWQVMFMGSQKIKQKIIPSMMFVGAVYGKAEEAINYYVSLFHNAKVGELMRYKKDELPDKEGGVKYASFTLAGQDFAAMESAYEHAFSFNEAISFVVHCDTQQEIDHYWEKLSADPKSEQCGWLKDRYGFSWQIVPTCMSEMLNSNDPQRIARVTKAFLAMKKFDIVKLQEAYT